MKLLKAAHLSALAIMVMGVSLQGALVWDDSDCLGYSFEYWFNQTSGNTLTVFTTGSTDTMGTLIDAQDVIVGTDSNSGIGTNFLISRATTTSWHGVLVERQYSWVSGCFEAWGYSVSGGMVCEKDNSSYDDPMVITVPGGAEEAICPAGDDDAYTFTLSQPGILVIYTEGSTDTFGQLENAYGIVATDNNSGAGANFRIEQSVPAGTYNLLVLGSSGGIQGNYELCVEFYLYQAPPDSISPTTAKKETSVSFTASGGGGHGSLSYQYSINGGYTWNTLNNPLYISLTWESLKVRAKWNGNWQYGPSDWSTGTDISLAKATQSDVYVSSVPSTLVYNQSAGLGASGGTGTGSYGYEVEDQNKAQIVNGNAVKALSGTGTVRVRSYREGDVNYERRNSDWSQPIQLLKAEQASVHLSYVPSSLVYDQIYYLTCYGGSGTGAYGYQVSDGTIAAIEYPNALKALSGTGTFGVWAYKEGDSNYNAKYSNWKYVNLEKASQSPPTSIYPSGVTITKNLMFFPSGGGGSGYYDLEFQSDLVNWIPFIGALYIDPGWESLSIKVHWAGNDNYHDSLYYTQSVTIFTDGDNDGLLDIWEFFYFGNVNPHASGDWDNDGLSNLVEFQMRTSPILADTDGDGILDGSDPDPLVPALQVFQPAN